MGKRVNRRQVLTGTVALAGAAAMPSLNRAYGGRLHEIGGSVEWYDAAKGYGFIKPDNGPHSILLQRPCLEHVGVERIGVGARMRLIAIERPNGLQAVRLLDLDSSTEFVGPTQRTHVLRSDRLFSLQPGGIG